MRSDADQSTRDIQDPDKTTDKTMTRQTSDNHDRVRVTPVYSLVLVLQSMRISPRGDTYPLIW